MREAVLVAGVRTAVGKAKKGNLRTTRPDELGAVVLKELLNRVPQVDPLTLDDVIMGCAFPEGEQGMNIARIAALRAGLPVEVPAMTVNRYCASGLQTIAMACERIMTGSADVLIAGGIESMSFIPMGGYKPAPNPHLMEHFPEVYMSMGHTAEEVARRYHVTREEQDRWALTSHHRAHQAIEQGLFLPEIVPVPVVERWFDEDGKLTEQTQSFSVDEGVRPDTSLTALSALPPVFHVQGTVTAGNSSQTSDGAAAVMVMSRMKAESLGIQPLAMFHGFQLSGVSPEVMGIGPVEAIPKLLKRTGVSLREVDRIELNEAFASQTLAVMKELDLNPEIVNVHGGAIALGHPLGCTGAKLTVSILHELIRTETRYGLVTMCVGGGMGAAGLFERVS